MNDDYKAIRDTLETVRRGRRAIKLARLGLLAISALFILLILALVLVPALDGLPRLAARVIALLAMGGAAAAWLVLSVIRRESARSAALAIERVNPGLNNGLISSVELVDASAGEGARSSFSRVLLDMHLASVREKLVGLNLKAAAPADQLKTPALVAGALLAAVLAMGAALPDRTASGLAALFTESLALPESPPEPTLPLTTGDFTLHYQFPAYTGIGDQTLPNTNGDIAALKGTVVTVTTRVLEPLAEANLVTSAGSRFQMKISGGVLLETSIVLTEPGTYHVEGKDKKGSPRQEASSHRLIVDEDLPPTITLLEPVADLEVAAEDALDISYESGDDFGVRKMDLVYKRGEEEGRIEIGSVSRDGRKRHAGDYKWTLAEMDFKPGDMIPFYLEVFDNDEVTPNKSGRSETRVLTIFSARKHHRALLARQDELVNMMIDHLASHLNALLAGERDSAKIRELEPGLVEEGSLLAKNIDELLAGLYEDEYADELVVEALENMSFRYAAAVSKRLDLVSQIAPAPDEAASGKQKDIDRAILETRIQYRLDLESDILYLDKLIKKQRIDDLLAEADDLYKAQADLADLLSEYKKTQDPALLAELQKAMADLESAFQNLMKQMAEMRKGLPEEFLNADAMDKANIENVADQMEKLRQALADGDMEAALSMAEGFLSKMGQWMAALESDAGGFGDMISRETMKKISELQEDLLDAIAKEQAIEDRLQEMQDRLLERQEREFQKTQDIRERVKEEIADLSRELFESQRAFYELKPERSMDGKPGAMDRDTNLKRSELGREITTMRGELQEIQKALDEGDIEKALDLARKAREKMEKNREGMEEYCRNTGASPKEKKDQLDNGWSESMDSADSIIEDLEALSKMGSSSMSADEKQQLEQLSAEQSAVREDVERMMEKYEEIRQEAPSLPGGVSQNLDQSSFLMYDASGEMMLHNPGEARTSASDARAQLENANRMLDEAQQQMQKSMAPGGGMPMMMGGGSRPRGRQTDRGPSDPEAKVEIPDEDKYSVPEEYREDILKAMKEESPEAYESLIRDYYERLVR